MENIHIDEYNLDTYPYIIPSVLFSSHDVYEKNSIIEKSDIKEYHFFYIINGTAIVNINSYESKKFELFSVKENSIIIVPPLLSYSIKITSYSLEMVQLKTLFYTCPTFAHRNIPLSKLFVPPKNSYPHTSVSIWLEKRVIDIEIYSQPYILLGNIINEIDSRMPGSAILLQNYISSLMLWLIRDSQNGYYDVFKNMDNICFYTASDMRDFPLPEQTQVLISKIRTWSSNPFTTASSIKMLAEFLPDNFRVEKPEQFPSLCCDTVTEINPNSNTPETMLKISTTDSSYYKIFITPEKNSVTDYIPYVNTGYITFNVKSNRPCNLWFSFVSSSKYHFFFKRIIISNPNIWQQVSLPFIRLEDNSHHSPYVMRASDYIKQNFHKKCELKDIAEHTNLSISHISRLFKSQTGLSLKQYINFIRLEKAKELLISTNDSLENIANKTGFYDATYFCKCFKRHQGCTPNIFRNQNSK